MADAKPFVISSFRGGMNSYDPPTALPEDQVIEAINVEFVGSMLGDRRLGHEALTLPDELSAYTGIWAMHRHLPTTNESDAQLWLLAGTPDGSATLAYKAGLSWTIVPLIDTPVVTADTLSQFAFESLHGKLFMLYRSAVDRIHVWDGTELRRAGLAQPEAPTAVEDGTAAPTGGYDGTRYFRVRYVVMSGSTVVLRSEPSEAFVLNTDATHAVGTVTRPALIDEGETDWEIEASINNGDWYRLDTIPVATTTYTDAIPFGVGYAVGSGSDLSDAIGSYTVIPSCKHVTAVDDRLMFGGNWSSSSLASQVIWTPVYLDPGAGNDERIALPTDPSLTLDSFKGGEITNIKASNGLVYVSKVSHSYRIIKQGQLNAAYEADLISSVIGGIAGSMVVGIDPTGNSVVFALDRNIGAYIHGPGGLTKCGRDIRPVWDTHSSDSTLPILARGVYFPTNRQVRWAFAEEGEEGTSLGLTLHVDEMQLGLEGYTRGWTVWDGVAVTDVACMILYSDNVEDTAAHSIRLVPVIARGDQVFVSESGDDDDGNAYAANITSRPFLLGSGSQKFGVRAAALIATATESTLDFSLIRDFGVEQSTGTDDIDLSPAAAETHVMPLIDNAHMSGCLAVQVSLADSSPAVGTWHVQQVLLIPSGQEKQ